MWEYVRLTSICFLAYHQEVSALYPLPLEKLSLTWLSWQSQALSDTV
jgi:hypothetical protein